MGGLMNGPEALNKKGSIFTPDVCAFQQTPALTALFPPTDESTGITAPQGRLLLLLFGEALTEEQPTFRFGFESREHLLGKNIREFQ